MIIFASEFNTEAMNRRIFLKKSAGYAALLGLSPLLVGCRKGYYTAADFVGAPKADAHFHYDTTDEAYLEYSNSLGMHLLSINVDGGGSIDKQLEIVVALRNKYPGKLDFLGTFSVDDFGKDSFADQAIARIERCMNLGAKGIKIWKNIGMVLQDEQGQYVMADHPAFAPVFTYLEKQGIPLTAHLGEPKSCWMPYEQMEVKGDANYYRQNPQYHMYQFPALPSYEDQIVARDHLLDRYPKLVFVGAHIGSQEWSLDEVAKRFDAYPNFYVDLAARMVYLYLHSVHDRQKLLSFLTTYQDRILYGSDIGISQRNPDRREQQYANMKEAWLEQWRFLATDDRIPSNHFTSESAPKELEGLQLPRKIVDKIFYDNTKHVFRI